MRCVDVNDGTELWKIDCWAGTGFGAALAISDGYLITHNCYDNQIYCFGKGPSQTTVTASPKVTTWGSSVVIEGMVTDQSAGTKQLEQAGRFPNGVPAVSDASQEGWMEYVYMQQGCPAYVEGVEVKLETLDPNNNFYEIGTVTSDASGMYKLMCGSLQYQENTPS